LPRGRSLKSFRKSSRGKGEEEGRKKKKTLPWGDTFWGKT